jgi:hypothetical protein
MAFFWDRFSQTICPADFGPQFSWSLPPK